MTSSGLDADRKKCALGVDGLTNTNINHVTTNFRVIKTEQ